MAQSTDPLVSLIQDPTAPKPVAMQAPSYGTATTEASAGKGTAPFDANRPPGRGRHVVVRERPVPLIFADPGDPGGAGDVLAMTQVCGASGTRPVAVQSHPTKGTVEYT